MCRYFVRSEKKSNTFTRYKTRMTANELMGDLTTVELRFSCAERLSRKHIQQQYIFGDCFYFSFRQTVYLFIIYYNFFLVVRKDRYFQQVGLQRTIDPSENSKFHHLITGMSTNGLFLNCHVHTFGKKNYFCN